VSWLPTLLLPGAAEGKKKKDLTRLQSHFSGRRSEGKRKKERGPNRLLLRSLAAERDDHRSSPIFSLAVAAPSRTSGERYAAISRFSTHLKSTTKGHGKGEGGRASKRPGRIGWSRLSVNPQSSREIRSPIEEVVPQVVRRRYLFTAHALRRGRDVARATLSSCSPAGVKIGKDLGSKAVALQLHFHVERKRGAWPAKPFFNCEAGGGNNLTEARLRFHRTVDGRKKIRRPSYGGDEEKWREADEDGHTDSKLSVRPLSARGKK